MISIVIPTYEQQGKGHLMLTDLLKSIRQQRIKYPYEIIVSDNSSDEKIKHTCKQFATLPIKYHFNPVRGASENINNAISLSSFDMVKIMCMDDKFMHPEAINLIVEKLQTSDWVICNSFYIKENGIKIRKLAANYEHGNFNKNKVGMPSCVAFKKNNLRFNTELKTFCDVYFYYQLFELYGEPGHIAEHIIGQRFWKGSLSHNQPPSHEADRQYLIKNGLVKIKERKVVTAVIVFNRPENIKEWGEIWDKTKQSGELVFIHNDNGEDYSKLTGKHKYIRRPNIGYDIGAFQDVCLNRLEGLPDYDLLLWCTDDTVPIKTNFVDQFTLRMTDETGVCCMHISDEYAKHIRTTGFMITKETASKLTFPANPIMTVAECHDFEHKSMKRSFYRQVRVMGKKVVQVSPLQSSPLYDKNYWTRNKKALMLKDKFDRLNEYKLFITLLNVSQPHQLPGMPVKELDRVP
jgi:glycosyltransferase involved in cell wall biosynthesis